VFLGSEIQKKAPARILEVGGEIDPHLWMDISLWAEGVSTIADALTQLDPEGAAFYRARAKEVEQTLQQEHITLQQLMRTVPEDRRYLVTSHDAFHYFARAYLSDGNDWKERCIAPEGLAPEGQLSPQDIRRVAEHLDKYRIQVVFPESNVNQDSLKKVISCCPHKVRCSEITLYGDAMGPGSYLEMIRHNVEALAQEWEQ